MGAGDISVDPSPQEAQHQENNSESFPHNVDDAAGESAYAVKQDDAPLTIPLGHQTSTSSLLTLPQMRKLVGDYPEEFIFLVEENRPRPLSFQYDGGDDDDFEDVQVIIERTLADEYFERYLTLVHQFRPMFELDDLRARYEKTMDNGLEKNLQSALFLPILALGATALDPVDRSRVKYSGDMLTKMALRILFPSWAVSFKGDLVLSQALTLCALYFCYVVEPLTAWKLVHMASTSIQQIICRRREHLPPDIDQDVIRTSWVCFLIECNILAEFHQPRSGIEMVVDRMSLPRYGPTFTTEGLFCLADISARLLLNRIHHAIYFTDSLSIYAGLRQGLYTMSTSDPDISLLRVCEELDRQLETWYKALPEAIKPDLSGASGNSIQACVLRLRYWSAKHNIYRPFIVFVTSQLAEESEIGVHRVILDRCETCLSACRMFLYSAGYVLSQRTPYTFSSAQCVLGFSLVVALAAQTPTLAKLVGDISNLLETAIGLLTPWALPNSSLECGLEIVTSIHRKLRVQP
ncbi:hypothetical protein PV08_02251 [Exophiala spinifera]|uniref:Transcription factor domain-containing protein n=1 Tax=Exophiala spinifera TaxID=91928 RepID=A0A0D1Z1Y1_9EURO|nr:uncharacterized protein PV08_02251 [Exophiala spinifera]KIW21671.1 hypothetical protein PV08_02251 [Exophiala spinifera]